MQDNAGQTVWILNGALHLEKGFDFSLDTMGSNWRRLKRRDKI